MITGIHFKSIPNYRDGAELKTDKSINLIYGLNGTGKTQLSRLLANRNDDKFKECDVMGLNDEKILVYNQDFINDNFYNSDEQKGIFTLSKQNVEVEKNLEKLHKELKELDGQLETKRGELQRKQEDEDTKNETFQDQMWSIKEQHCKESKEIFFDGLKGNKKKLAKLILEKYQQNNIANNPPRDLQTLEKELQTLTSTQQECLENIESLTYDALIQIEKDPIWGEIIVGNQGSTIGDLIKNLGNELWVKQGREYIKQDPEICPFCQKETITQDFRKSLEEYFDKAYEEKIVNLQRLKQDYKNYQSEIPSKSTYYRDNILTEKDAQFENLYLKLENVIKENLTKIEEKIKEPNRQIELKYTASFFDELNAYLQGKQKEIEKLNNDLANKKQAIKKLEEEFWGNMLVENKITINEYLNSKNEIEASKNEIEEEIKNIETNISDKKKQISAEQGTDIENAINEINNSLKQLGILSFKIQEKERGNRTDIDKDKPKYYVIVREGENEPSFKSLSEGEKTLISFLYFLQLCQGQENQDEISNKKIIVIDDPISSLSFNYVFDIAQYIKMNFFEKSSQYRQIFILTHHLYFFHELLGKIQNKKNIKAKYFRLIKDENNQSDIKPMQENEILNDYQTYWQILKEYKDGQNKLHKAIIPNTMRNIIEHFIGFVCCEKNWKDIDELKDDIQYKTFCRYVDRESHSDLTNLTDSKEIDINRFFDIFRKIFKHLGHSAHYEKMMDIEQK